MITLLSVAVIIQSFGCIMLLNIVKGLNQRVYKLEEKQRYHYTPGKMGG